MTISKLKRNPFRPDKPITEFDLFAGRSDELKVLVNSLFQTGHENARHMIVTGPRGIGKSSFINQIRSLADDSPKVLRALDIDETRFTFNYAIVKHTSTKTDTVEKVATSLVTKMLSLTDKDRTIKKLSTILENLKLTVGIPGILNVEYQPETSSEISRNVVEAVRTIWPEVEKQFVGMAIIIDEIDTIAECTSIASFLKITTEELIDAGLHKVVLYLVGLSGVMDALTEDHASIHRVFETIELRHLRPEESREVITRTLGSMPETERISISESAIRKVLEIASGFPAPIHSLCFEAYNNDTDDFLDDDDMDYAVDQLVTRIRITDLRKVFSEVGSGDYRRIIVAMANHESIIVPLREIAEEIGRTPSGTSSYMTRLVNDSTVVRTDRGMYKFADPLLRLYVQKLDVLEPQLPLNDTENEKSRPLWNDG